MPKAVLLPHAPPHPLYFLVGEGLKSGKQLGQGPDLLLTSEIHPPSPTTWQ